MTAPFTPAREAWSSEYGWVPLGWLRRVMRRDNRITRKVYNPSRNIRRWLPCPTARPW